MIIIKNIIKWFYKELFENRIDESFSINEFKKKMHGYSNIKIDYDKISLSPSGNIIIKEKT